ncbi:peroxiredoxin [Candidatus Saccharibacteria bacterium]|nr:peroxiredoxin [Candidatus Saccharibacteria bacterium]
MKQPPYDAPDFTLTGTDEQPVSLKDYAGKWLVLYFYPKDDTPGCTVEACSLRDAHADITALGAHVVGISKDDAPIHAKFRAKHSLNFNLLSDPSGEVIQAYGCWGEKMFGTEGILRRTFIINPDGTVVKVFGRVTPDGHGDQVVAELKKLQG